MQKVIAAIIVLITISVNVKAQKDIHEKSLFSNKVVVKASNKLKRLSYKKVISQNIWILIDLDKNKKSFWSIKRAIEKYNIGGVLIKNASPSELIEISNYIKPLSRIPVMVGAYFDDKIKFNNKDLSLDLRTIQHIKSPLKLWDLGEYTSGFFTSCGLNFIHVNNNSYEIPSDFMLSAVNHNLIVSNNYIYSTDRLIPSVANTNIFDQCKLLEFKTYKELFKKIDTEIKSDLKKIKKDKKLYNAIRKNCMEMLMLKYSVIDKKKRASVKKLSKKYSESSIRLTIDNAINSSVSVLLNLKSIPLMNLEKKKIAAVSFGKIDNEFQYYLKKYTQVDVFAVNNYKDKKSIDSLLNLLSDYNQIILDVNTNHFKNDTTGSYNGITDVLYKITSLNKSILSVFGDFEIINDLKNHHNLESIIYSFSDSKKHQKAAAQIIFGGVSSTGKLPFETKHFAKDRGFFTKGDIRFEYTIPEACGIDGAKLDSRISEIANEGIAEQAFPGCQILIAKDKKIIYHKQFGYHTYYHGQEVKEDDIYDLASVTKILGTLPGLMKLVDEKKINLDNKFSDYWDDFKNSNKKDLILRDVLSHQARLTPWIPYWRKTVDSIGFFKKNVYSYNKSDEHSLPVNFNMYLNKNMKKEFFKIIKESPLLEKKRYKYSGLAFFIYPEIISNMTGSNYEEYMKQEFYHPLGAYTLTYNPLRFFKYSRIIPTENDEIFRHSLIRGYVHDESAAVFGGVSGNAGLFSTAGDIAKIMQMYLQKGEYGGHRFISKKTMEEFTRCQFCRRDNRRGLGFDKPLINNHKLKIKDTYPATSASKASFGHSGFTGTFTWADPEYNLVFIFLSNRVYPTRENRKIYDLNIRPRILQSIYDLIPEEKN